MSYEMQSYLAGGAIPTAGLDELQAATGDDGEGGRKGLKGLMKKWLCLRVLAPSTPRVETWAGVCAGCTALQRSAAGPPRRLKWPVSWPGGQRRKVLGPKRHPSIPPAL